MLYLLCLIVSFLFLYLMYAAIVSDALITVIAVGFLSLNLTVFLLIGVVSRLPLARRTRNQEAESIRKDKSQPPVAGELVTDVWDLPDGTYVALLASGRVIALVNSEYQSFEDMSDWRFRTGAKGELSPSDTKRQAQFYETVAARLNLVQMKK